MRSFFWRRIAVTLGLAFLGVQVTQAQFPLIVTGSVWKYLDNGSDQGATWRGVLFDDSLWASGPAQLGYGDGDEATVVNSGPTTNRFVTTYFRRTFGVADPSSVTSLVVRLLRDDGGVAYLNGVEVFRSNITNETVTAQTLAAVNVPAGDETTNFYSYAISPASLVSGDNVMAVEIHQVATNSTDISFDLELLANVPPVPPVVAVTSPADGATLVTANVPITATASDGDGVITRVDFYVNGVKAGEKAAAPYVLTWPNVVPGQYVLTAVATDNSGLRTTSAPVNIIISLTLIPGGTNWKYLDDGSDAGTAWRELVFDDSGWSNGLAQFGYGDGDEITVINGGPDTNRFITTYFRHAFAIIDPSAFSNLIVRVLRDDGAIVYLNNIEVFRSNMPTGEVNHLTMAPTAVEDSTFRATNVNTGLLIAGDNLVAVEIHQSGITSSDVSFDLELIPNVPPTPPVVNLTAPAANATFVAPVNVTVNASATDFDDPVALVEFYDGTNKLGQDASEPYSVIASNLSLGSHTLRAVATDNSGRQGTSAPVNITMVGAPIVTRLIATGSVWKYLDTGTDQGSAWRAPVFNDTGWSNGVAELGYGDTADSRPETTLIRSGPAGSFYITYYFRHTFDVTNAASFTNLAFGVVRDDGAVVYLNGTEIFRMNMPATNPITFMTRAPTSVGGTNEAYFYPTNLGAGALIEGANVLAVEIHQNNPTSSDLSFDLSLIGTAPPIPLTPPPLAIAPAGAGVVISWPGTGYILQQAGSVAGPWGDLISATSPYAVGAPTGQQFYRLRTP